MPVIGEPADLLNASIYLAEGNYLDASLSAAGAIPFAGWAASGAQIVKNTYRAANAAMEVADTVSDGIRLADNAPLTAATPPASTITTFDPVPPMVKMPDTPIAVPKTPDIAPPATATQPYEVGVFSDLVKRSEVGDGLDIHHVPQTQPAKQVIENYSRADAPAIALPKAEHQAIPTQRGEYAGTLEELVAKDLDDLRDFTDAPESAITELSDLIGRTYLGE